ncbi:MAG: hypothetical protein IJS86_01315 [Lachnospiraceae bacterium]|nr:hypothetical protein [Lachnospiraceae bacterium]
MAVNPVTVFAAEPADVPMLPETTQTPDTDVYVRAMTAPVLESVEIGIAEPVTGAELADIPYYVSMELGGEQYDIDPDTWDVFWTVSDDMVLASGPAKKDPERLTVSWNGNKRRRYDDLIKPDLPENINVYVMDDSINSLPVSWNIVKEESTEGTVKEGIAYDEAGYVYTKEEIDGMDDLSLVFIGYCVIPEDLLYFEDDPYIEEVKDDDGRIKEVR